MGPAPAAERPAASREVVPAVIAEAKAWELGYDRSMWWPRMFSYVVWLREIWTSWTAQSIVTQTSWRITQMFRTRVNVSLVT